MFKALSYKFANILVNNDVIESEDFEIYRYGFETLIYFIVNIFMALFIGIIFDRFIHTMIFLICYCTLRQFTGGYHARNYTECTLAFVGICVFTIVGANNIDINRYNYLLILILIGSIFVIYKFSPLEHRNKPLSEGEKKKYKLIAIKIVTTISCIFTFSLVFNIFIDYFIYCLFAVVWIAVLLVLGFYIKFDR